MSNQDSNTRGNTSSGNTSSYRPPRGDNQSRSSQYENRGPRDNRCNQQRDNRGNQQRDNRGNQQRDNRGNQQRGPRRDNQQYDNRRPLNHEGAIHSYEQLEKAWQLELIKNPNAKSSEFVQSKRVQVFFASDFTLQERFTKETEKQMRSKLLHHKLDWEKTARMYRSQGLYTWAEQCEAFAKNPNGRYPSCTHAELREGQFKHKDGSYNDDGYNKWLNRVTQGQERGGTGSKLIDTSDPKYRHLVDEKSNAELGEELSGNCNNLRRGKPCNCEGRGHPDKLIAKIRESMVKYPEYYRKSDTSVY